MSKRTELDKKLREIWTKAIFDLLSTLDSVADLGYDKDNILSFPVVDDDGNEKYITITITVPQKRDGEDYDSYSAHADYEFKKAENKKKADEKARLKAEKIKKDEEYRRKKKAEKEENGSG